MVVPSASLYDRSKYIFFFYGFFIKLLKKDIYINFYIFFIYNIIFRLEYNNSYIYNQFK